MKYSMYAKKNEPKFKKKKFETLNWETDSRGYKICPEGMYLTAQLENSMMKREHI